MIHIILYGLLLGYGAAVPIGPMNLELIRRNLSFGPKVGLCFGLGACLVDTTYIILIGLGALLVLRNPIVLNIVGVLGAIVLFWFGVQALKAKSSEKDEYQLAKNKKKAYWQHTRDSYILTMLNPFTIIFWSSVSSQAALIIAGRPHAYWLLAASVLIATVSWIIGLNTVLALTRHKISGKTLRAFNIFGGCLLIGFALYGLAHVFL